MLMHPCELASPVRRVREVAEGQSRGRKGMFGDRGKVAQEADQAQERGTDRCTLDWI